MSTSISWSGAFTKGALCPGTKGVVVEGTVKETRVHSVFLTGPSMSPEEQADALPTRYVVVVMQPIDSAYDRMYDKREEEVDYQWNLGRKGMKNYHEPQLIAQNDLVSRLGGSNGSEPINSRLLDASQRKHLHPHRQGCFEFWIDQDLAGVKDIEPGTELRLTTINNSIFVDRFTVLNAKASDELTGGWTNALLQHQDAENKYVNLEHESEVNDDEWSDD